MKKCRFNDPATLASFFDGGMDRGEEEEFARHLTACRDCAGALLDLERDLFLMGAVEFARNPRRLTRARARFTLGAQGLALREMIGMGVAFVPLAPSPVRGESGGGKRVFRCERGGVRVDVGDAGEGRVTLHLAGVLGRKVFLYRDGRLLEARAKAPEEHIVIDDLPKGNYLLFVEGCGSYDIALE